MWKSIINSSEAAPPQQIFNLLILNYPHKWYFWEFSKLKNFTISDLQWASTYRFLFRSLFRFFFFFCKVSVKGLIFSKVVDLYIAGLLKSVNHSFKSILQKDCLDFENNVQKAWIKNQYNVAYTFTINTSSKESRMSVEKILPATRVWKILAIRGPEANNSLWLA